MGSLSGYQRSAGAVQSIGWPLVWCPKYRKRVLVGPIAGRLRELLLSEATIRKYIDEQTTRPPRGRP